MIPVTLSLSSISPAVNTQDTLTLNSPLLLLLIGWLSFRAVFFFFFLNIGCCVAQARFKLVAKDGLCASAVLLPIPDCGVPNVRGHARFVQCWGPNVHSVN